MTKTKRNLILVVSLLFAIFTLCSVFADVSFHTPQTVEATETTDTRAPGLYVTGTTTFVKDGDNDMTWKYLVDNGKIKTTDGHLQVVDKTLAGELVCGSVENLTSLECAFDNCKGLTYINVDKLDTKNVTNMLSVFYNCAELTSLDVTGFNTGSVKNMGQMFAGCRKLTKLDVGNLDTSAVTSMGYMFGNCESLTSLDVSGFNTSSVEKMEEMFAGCKKLTSLDVSGFDTSNVTDMTGMFTRCASLTSLNVSNFVTTKVKSMLGMFTNMRSLRSLDVGSFKTSKVTAFAYMFSGTNLAELDLRSFDFSSADSSYGTLGMIGISDEENVDMFTDSGAEGFVTMYQKAMNNEDISTDLEKLNAEYAGLYKQEIVGKTGDELGYAGRIYVVGMMMNTNSMEESLDLAKGIFETKIGKIYLPATASSVNISLPGNTTYVAKSGDTEFELEQQILYGYKDLNMTEGTVLVAKTADVENTGVETNITMIAIAIVNVASLAFVATKKKRTRNCH